MVAYELGDEALYEDAWGRKHSTFVFSVRRDRMYQLSAGMRGHPDNENWILESRLQKISSSLWMWWMVTLLGPQFKFIRERGAHDKLPRTIKKDVGQMSHFAGGTLFPVDITAVACPIHIWYVPVLPGVTPRLPWWMPSFRPVEMPWRYGLGASPYQLIGCSTDIFPKENVSIGYTQELLLVNSPSHRTNSNKL